MQVKGNQVFDVTKEKLWDYLMDPEVLAKITPGVSKLKILEEDHYETTLVIKIGPAKGNFKGKLKVVDKNAPDSFAIEMEQLSKIGNAHARIEMNISDAEANASELAFDGKAKLSGVVARTGQRVLSGVANSITKEVFKSLKQHIAEDQSSEETASETAPTVENAKSEPPSPEVQHQPERTKTEETLAKKDPPVESSPSTWTVFMNFWKNLFKKSST